MKASKMAAVKNFVCLTSIVVSLAGCASEWKIQGGPRECVAMCAGWNMELTGMVGVGNQDAAGPGATACVCQVRGTTARSRSTSPSSSTELASSGTAAGMSAAVVALEQARQQQQHQQPLSAK